jgi:hypothetical protein
VVQRCWDQVRWGIEGHTWRFERRARPLRRGSPAADLRARIAQLEEQRTALAAAAEARRDLTLVIGRLADFSTKVRQNLDLLDWTTRRDVIRLMVRRIEIDDGQIEIVFHIPPLSGGSGRDHTSQSTQHCPGERGTHVRLVGALPQAGQGLRGAHAHPSGLCSTRDDPPHDAPDRKSLSSLMNSPDGLSGATLCELNACAGRSGQHVHLHMNSTFLDRERRFFYRLGQRRMGVASAGDVLG